LPLFMWWVLLQVSYFLVKVYHVRLLYCMHSVVLKIRRSLTHIRAFQESVKHLTVFSSQLRFCVGSGSPEEEVVVGSHQGILNRLRVGDISIQSRSAK
jgi:hypothetical protein